MKRRKPHRYVSNRGPLAAPESALARAIAVAENEGWPVATARPALRRVPDSGARLRPIPRR